MSEIIAAGQALSPGESRRHFARRPYIETTVVVGLTLVESFVGYRIVASRFGTDGFAQFSVAVRLLALLQPALLAGTSVTLPRLLPRLTSDGAGAQIRALSLASLSVVVIGSGVVATLFLAFPASFAGLILNDAGSATLMRSFGVLLIGSCLHGVAYAHARGRLAERRANGLLLVNFVLVPLGAVLIAPSLVAVLASMGVAMAVAAAIVLLPIAHGPVVPLAPAFRRVLRDGLPRVPGEFATFGILALPPIVAAHQRGLIDAGYLAFGVALLSAFASALAPISLVQVPRISAALARGDHASVARHVRATILFVATFGIALTLAVQLLLPLGMRIYFGRGYDPAVGIIRFALFALPTHAIYMGLRGIVDAYSDQPINMRNGMIAFAGGATATGLILAIEGQAAPVGGIIVGSALLSALTLRSIKRILDAISSSVARAGAE